jgi:hypothetical protein
MQYGYYLFDKIENALSFILNFINHDLEKFFFKLMVYTLIPSISETHNDSPIIPFVSCSNLQYSKEKHLDGSNAITTAYRGIKCIHNSHFSMTAK